MSRKFKFSDFSSDSVDKKDLGFNKKYDAIEKKTKKAVETFYKAHDIKNIP
jgi:hypothetical protein